MEVFASFAHGQTAGSDEGEKFPPPAAVPLFHARVIVAPGLRRERTLRLYRHCVVDDRPRCTALGGGIMVKRFMEGLVLDVVLSVIGDEAEHLTLKSDFDVLDVDQLTITYIVLALESRLGIELPSHLEDARTIAELEAGARDALRANVATKCRFSQSDEMPLIPIGRPALSRHSSRRNLSQTHRWSCRLRRSINPRIGARYSGERPSEPVASPMPEV